MTTGSTGKAPEIALKQVSLQPESGAGLWRIHWRVENLGRERLQLKTVRFPHGQFRANEQNLDQQFMLGCDERGEFEATIACNATPGETVENAFAILSAAWQNNPWRIFVRLRVSVNGKGEPHAITELITTQQVGFSTQLQSDG